MVCLLGKIFDENIIKNDTGGMGYNEKGESQSVKMFLNFCFSNLMFLFLYNVTL